MSKTEHLIIFTVLTVFIQVMCLVIYFYGKVDNEVGLIFEISELLPIYLLVRGLFRRCPVCGKRKVTITDGYGGTQYITDNGVCRNCKSHVSIMYDRKELETIYYTKNEYGGFKSIKPIWKTSK